MPRWLALLAMLAHLAPAPAAAESGPRPASPSRRGAEWLARARARVRLPEGIARPLRLGICQVRGHCTLAADRLEARLPHGLARAFHRVRLASPLALAAFAGQKLAEDPVFMGAVGIGASVLQHLEIPAMIALGVNPGLAVAIHELTEIPVNLAIVCWRQHSLRADRSQSFFGTLRGLGRDYRDFVEKRRQENRRFMAERSLAARGALPTLAAALP